MSYIIFAEVPSTKVGEAIQSLVDLGATKVDLKPKPAELQHHITPIDPPKTKKKNPFPPDDRWGTPEPRSNRQKERRDAFAKAHGLEENPSMRSVLIAHFSSLSEGERVTSQELKAMVADMGYNPHSVSPQLTVLKKRGLIRQTDMGEYERETQVVLA